MVQFKKCVKKIIDLSNQYQTAISIDSDGNIFRAFSMFVKFSRAHLKYGVSPIFYSLYNFDGVPENRWAEYVVDQKKFNSFLVANSKSESRRIAGNKIQFHRHCVNNGIPVIPILCVVSKDNKFKIDGLEFVDNLSKWLEVIMKSTGEIFIKPVIGSKGDDSFVALRVGDRFKFAGANGSAEDIYNYLQLRLNKPGKGFLVQPRMRPYPPLVGVVSANGLSTVRVITHIRNGKPEILMACLKIIAGNNVHDNFSQGMSNNLVALINIETGVLETAWGSLERNWPKMAKFSHHPDTGAVIEGSVFPFWRELVQLALKAQESLPSIQTIGWDIALTSEGLFIVEANTTYGVALFQVARQKGLKKEFYSALSPQETSIDSVV